MSEVLKRYSSRKFAVTLTVIGATVWLALSEKMDNNVAMVLTACVVGYHLANAYTTGKGAEK